LYYATFSTTVGILNVMITYTNKSERDLLTQRDTHTHASAHTYIHTYMNFNE